MTSNEARPVANFTPIYDTLWLERYAPRPSLWARLRAWLRGAR